MPNCEVEDGPLGRNEDKYQEQKIRVLHLLKNPTKCNKDMREALDKYGVSAWFWKISAIRTYFIITFYEKKKTLNWNDIKPILNDHRKLLYGEIIKSAIVNLSKKPGNRTTMDEEVCRFAEQNFEEWFQQLLKYKPNVIICGGTFNAVFNTLKKKGYVKNEDKRNTLNGEQYFIFEKESLKAVFLGCCHPSRLSYTHKYREDYESFCENWTEIYKKEPFLRSM
jgi:hypothetical protein